MKPSILALLAVLLTTTACPKPSPPPTSILRGMIAGAAAVGSITVLLADAR